MFLLLTFKLLNLFPPTMASAAVYDVVVTNANLIDGVKILENQTLFIREGRIVRISPELVDASDTIKMSIDGSELYLIPGFVIPRNLAEPVLEEIVWRLGITQFGALAPSLQIVEIPQVLSSKLDQFEAFEGADGGGELALGMALSSRANVFEELRKIRNLFTVQQHKIAPTSQHLLRMATLHGARKLGHKDLGLLEVGFVADIVAIKKPKVQILTGPYRYVVEIASLRDIAWVLKKGQMHASKKSDF